MTSPTADGRRLPAPPSRQADWRSTASAGSSPRSSPLPSCAALHALPLQGRLRRASRSSSRSTTVLDDRAPHGHLERVLPLLLRLGRPERAPRRPPHVVLVHDGDGDRRARGRASSSRTRSRTALFDYGRRANLVRAAFVGLWAQMNYEQLTSLFRVEERAVAFVTASLVNVAHHDRGHGAARRRARPRARSASIVGNFIGTLAVYLGAARLPPRAARPRSSTATLLREMNRFGMPLVPSALLLWVTNFSDRFFLVQLTDTAEVGLYSVGVRIASAMVLLLTAFRTAWPAFAYSIAERRRGEADVRLRAHLPRRRSRAGWRPRSRCSRRGSCGWLAKPTSAEASRVVGAARVLDRRLRRLHRDLDRRRARAPHAVQLGHHRARGGRQHRAEPDPDPAVRDDGRRRRHRRRLRGDVRRHGLVVAARLPGAVPVAPGRDRGGRRRWRSSSPASSPTPDCSSPRSCSLVVSARARAARLLPAGRAAAPAARSIARP